MLAACHKIAWKERFFEHTKKEKAMFRNQQSAKLQAWIQDKIIPGESGIAKLLEQGDILSTTIDCKTLQTDQLKVHNFVEQNFDVSETLKSLPTSNQHEYDIDWLFVCQWVHSMLCN